MSVWLLDCLSPEQLRRDVGHRLASPFIWQEQGEIDKKPKRQRQQQGEKHDQHDRHNEVGRVHMLRCAPAQHNSKKPKSLSNKHNRCYVVRHQQAQPKNHSASESSKTPSSKPKTARITSWAGYIGTGHVMANHLANPGSGHLLPPSPPAEKAPQPGLVYK